jgi:hypothetical protein
MLKFMSESSGLISPWLHHGKPDDAVFKVVATFPVVRMPPGVRQAGLPLDVEELILGKKRRDALALYGLMPNDGVSGRLVGYHACPAAVDGPKNN